MAIFSWNSLDMDCPSLQPFVIVSATHLLVMSLVSYSRISACLLHRSNGEESEHEDYEHMQPSFVVRGVVVVKSCLSYFLS